MERPDLDLLRGAIDMHAHTHPALFRRTIDDAALAKYALEYGMSGFVLKDHDSSTTGRAYYVNKMYDGTSVQAYGAIVLNRTVGGLNPYVVQGAIHYGAKVVWMPSNHSKWHFEYFHMSDYPVLGRPKKQLPGPGVTVLDDEGELKPEVLTILDLIAEADICLATGHLSIDETRKLLDEANRRGVKRILYTHANWALGKIPPAVQRELIAKGAMIEYVAVCCASPAFNEQHPSELAAWIKELGPDSLILTSDLGQAAAAPHPEGLRMLACALLDEGVPYESLERMLQRNPRTLLGINE
ncbi:MAG: hypothetical protein IT307_04515 [Chloroflexi bacterium]|nr:hypothetical protein [Chloroflexota bacterium]